MKFKYNNKKIIKNNGFTLIELLAVIVILAVLALIVTPTITGIIGTTKESAKLRSAEGYYSAIKNRLLNNILDTSNPLLDGVYTTSELENKGLEYRGKGPENGMISILNGKIASTELEFEGTKITINNAGGASLIKDSKIYGLKWDGNDNYTRLDDASGLNACVGTNTDTCTNDFDKEEIFSEIHDITVNDNKFVYIPKFYIKKVVTGDTWEWYISKSKQDDSYYLPECFHDIATNKELPYVLVGKYNASLDNTGTKLASRTNVLPLVNKTINEFRTLAASNNIDDKSGYHLYDIHTLDVIQTLFYIEFGTLNSQSIMKGYSYGQSPWLDTHKVVSVNGSTITIISGAGEQYKVGQIIDIATQPAKRDVAKNLRITAISGDTLTVEDIIETEHKSAIAVNNIIYNVSNITGQTDHLLTTSGSSIDNNSGKYSMSYRGIENLYGNIWQFLDGVNIDNASNSIYTNKNPKTYESDKIDGDYLKIGYFKSNTDGWVTKMGYDSNNPFINIPESVGGTEDTKYADYYNQSTEEGKRVILSGGSWLDISLSGLSYFDLYDSSSHNLFYAGTRLVKKAI